MSAYGGVSKPKGVMKTVVEFEGGEWRDEEPAEWVSGGELGEVGLEGSVVVRGRERRLRVLREELGEMFF